MYTPKSDTTIIQLVKWQDEANEMLKRNQDERTLYLDRSNELAVHTGSSSGTFGRLVRKAHSAVAGKPKLIETLEDAYVSISGYQTRLPGLRPLSSNDAAQAIQALDPSRITVKALHDTCSTILGSDAGMIAAARARLAIFASQYTGHELKETMQYRTRRLTDALCSTINSLISGEDKKQIPVRAGIFEHEVLPSMRETKGMPDESVRIVESHVESRKRVLKEIFYPRTPAPATTEPLGLMQWLDQEVRKIEINDEITNPDGPEISKQAGKLREHLQKAEIVESLAEKDLRQILAIKEQIAWDITNNRLYRDFRLSFKGLFDVLDAIEQQLAQKPAVSQPPSSDCSLSESTDPTSFSSETCLMTPYPPLAMPYDPEEGVGGAIGGTPATSYPVYPLPHEGLTVSNCHTTILALIQKTKHIHSDEMKINIEEDIKTNNREVEAAATFINTNQTQIELETLQELSEKTMEAMEIDSGIKVSLLPLAEAIDMAIVINISLIQA